MREGILHLSQPPGNPKKPIPMLMKNQHPHFDSIDIHHLHQPVSGISGCCIVAECGCFQALKRQICVRIMLKHAFQKIKRAIFL